MSEEYKPLAALVRPGTIDEVVGQAGVVGGAGVVANMLKNKKPLSLIIQGPPGSGKTTIAEIIIKELGYDYVRTSAVSATSKQIREIIEQAKQPFMGTHEPTILFLDEIHRFNKAQQDILLPAVENGTLMLIGATTENPRFEVNDALMSRCHLVRLLPLGEEEIRKILDRALEYLRTERKQTVNINEEALQAIAVSSGGDARQALTILEAAANQGPGFIELDDIERLAERSLQYDRAGEQHYDYISAFIKSMRRSDANAALYYLTVMLEGGEDVKFIARRMMIFASEDVGNANPQALSVAVAVARAVEQVGMPEARINLSQGAIYLAETVKSRRVMDAVDAVTEDVRAGGAKPPPGKLVNETSVRAIEPGSGPDTDSCMPAGMEERKYLK